MVYSVCVCRKLQNEAGLVYESQNANCRGGYISYLAGWLFWTSAYDESFSQSGIDYDFSEPRC